MPCQRPTGISGNINTVQPGRAYYGVGQFATVRLSVYPICMCRQVGTIFLKDPARNYDDCSRMIETTDLLGIEITQIVDLRQGGTDESAAD